MTTRPGYAWDEATSQWIEIASAVAESPVYYQATPPTSAPTGSIWVDSDAFVPSIDSAQMLRWRKTMTGGQTSLSGTDDSGLPLSYTPGYEQLYINGVLQVRGQDYVATTGTTVTGLTALVANDVVEIFSVVARAVGDVYTQAQSDSRFVNKSVGGLNLVIPTGATNGTVNPNGSVTIGNAVSSVTVNGVFSSTYDNYRIIASNVDASTNDQQIRILVNGSSSYNGGYTALALSGASLSGGSLIATSAGVPMFLTSSDNSSWSCDVMNPFLSTRTFFSAGGSTGYNYVLTGAAGYTLGSESSTGFTFIPGSGTITGGTIRIYGYNNGA